METSAFHDDEGGTDQVEVRRPRWRCRSHHCLLLPQHSVRFAFYASVCLYAFRDLILLIWRYTIHPHGFCQVPHPTTPKIEPFYRFFIGSSVS